MDLQGSGTGQLSYQINNEPPVTGSNCTVEGVEDDASAVLQLTFGFKDTVHGLVGVSVSVYGFSPQTTEYRDNMDILVTMLSGPSWSSGAGSTVTVTVATDPANGGCRYRGVFYAENLAMVGAGGNALAIKFASYDVTLEPPGSDA